MRILLRRSLPLNALEKGTCNANALEEKKKEEEE